MNNPCPTPFLQWLIQLARSVSAHHQAAALPRRQHLLSSSITGVMGAVMMACRSDASASVLRLPRMASQKPPPISTPISARRSPPQHNPSLRMRPLSSFNSAGSKRGVARPNREISNPATNSAMLTRASTGSEVLIRAQAGNSHSLYPLITQGGD